MTRARLVATNASRETVLAERLEDASSLWGKFMGLMGRRPLPAGDGLWLPDSNNIHMLFMRFPIDAIFVTKPDAAGRCRVVTMRRSLPAWRGVVWWASGAKGVLELPAGTIERTGTQDGDEIVLGRAGETAGGSAAEGNGSGAGGS